MVYHDNRSRPIGENVTIRPAPKHMVKRIAVGFGAIGTAATLLIVMLYGRQLEDTWQYFLLVGVLFAVAVIVLAYLRTAKVTVTREYVEKKRFWIWKTRLRRDRVYGLMGPLVRPLEHRVVPFGVLRERDSADNGVGPRIKLNGLFWPEKEMARVASILDIPYTTEELPISEFERRAPGALDFPNRRPAVFAAIAVFGGLSFLFCVILPFALYDEFNYSPENDRDLPPQEVSAEVEEQLDLQHGDVEDVFSSRDWNQDYEGLSDCRVLDGEYGWQKEKRSSSEGPVDESEINSFIDFVEDLGYEVEIDDQGGTQWIEGNPPWDRHNPSYEEIRVLVEPEAITVAVFSDCDVP